MGSEKYTPKIEQRHEQKVVNKELSKELEKPHHSKFERKNKSHEKEQSAAQEIVAREAISSKELSPDNQENKQSPTYHRSEEKMHSFNTTMYYVRQGLPKAEKVFSRVIHQPAVEKVSEATAKTIARPSGIIGATVAIFIGLLSIYGVARFAGFSLSGSEMPLLLIGGFIAGLVLELFIRTIMSIKRLGRSQ